MIWIACGVLALAALVVAHQPLLWQRHALALMHGGTFGEGGYEPRELVSGGNQPAAPREPAASELLDVRALEAAAEYAGTRSSRALIVSRHGYLVFERYWAGSNFDTPVESGALARILLALVTGAAVGDRSIGWPDEPVGNFIAQWREDPRGAITVRNLLQLSSGLMPDPANHAESAVDSVAVYLQQPLAAPPGQRWLDQSADPDLLAHVITLATRQRYAQYLSSAIWRRIGAADASLWLDHAGGAAHIDHGFRAHQGDWMRVAEVLLTNGRYQGDEIVSPKWLPQILQPTRPNGDYGSYVRLGAHAAAGMTPYASNDVVLVAGGGNRLWLIPSLQIAILRTGDEPLPSGSGASLRDSHLDWDDGRIPNLIVRGARDFVPAAARPGADLRQLVPNH